LLRFKTSKTLTGIETLSEAAQYGDSYSFKTSKTLTGIETKPDTQICHGNGVASKHLKPLQGLKLLM
jgi:hypothetical protein